MKLKNYLFLLFIPVIVTVGCHVYKVAYYDYDRSINFSKYKTFAWLPDKDTSKSQYNNEIIRNNARDYFSQYMTEKCYTANIDTPDVFLELVITTQKKEKSAVSGMPSYLYPPYPISPFPYFYAFPYFYNYDFSYVHTQVGYVEGAVTLNVIDRKLNRLVWTGTAKGDLDDAINAKGNINSAVHSIIRKYPR